MADLTFEGRKPNNDKPELQVVSELKLQCLGCDKPTVEILVVNKGIKYPKLIVQVLCHRCGQLSFRKTYEESQVIYNVLEPYKLVDAQMISDEHILIEVR